MLPLVPLWPPPFLAILRYSVLVLISTGIFESLAFLRGLRRVLGVSREQIQHFQQGWQGVEEGRLVGTPGEFSRAFICLRIRTRNICHPAVGTRNDNTVNGPLHTIPHTWWLVSFKVLCGKKDIQNTNWWTDTLCGHEIHVSLTANRVLQMLYIRLKKPQTAKLIQL